MRKENLPFWNVLTSKYFKYVVVLLFFVVVTFFLDTNNIFVWHNAGKTIREQEKQTKLLEQEIESNESRIRQLTSEKDSLEKFAREQYQFHEEGEDVYIVSH